MNLCKRHDVSSAIGNNRYILELLGCRVSAHACGESAWAELVNGAPFDLLVTDVELGTGMKGTEFARCAATAERMPHASSAQAAWRHHHRRRIHGATPVTATLPTVSIPLGVVTVTLNVPSPPGHASVAV
jgi:CheY-like chemotaxis protein